MRGARARAAAAPRRSSPTSIWANEDAVYCIRGVRRGVAAAPGGGRAGGAGARSRRAAATSAPAAERGEQRRAPTARSSPSGASAARRAAGPRPPAPRPRRRARATGATSAGASADAATQHAASTAIGPSMAGGDSCALRGAPSLRGSPRKTAPNTLTKQATASAPISGQRRRGERGRGQAAPAAPIAAREQAEVDEELADEAVQRRQAADGDRADQEAAPRSTACACASPPRWSISRVCVAWIDRAGAEEEQRLEQGVVPDVQQARRPGPARPSPAGPATGPSSARPRPMTMMPMFSMLW